ncbi:hypothetical protein A33M_3596 [Rhodovulum sp. PH10]|uniref:FeoA family protein n=1 Tax=Rhodovulum sp. PH10 TaxID=1187851 RepID=UPI00027C2D18|nr:FeoA family protein [Rhodovulum sp. PH10]EJW11062.1 hypothetical protein A33M_3596 [Rhodovulum sp. PH10]
MTDTTMRDRIGGGGGGGADGAGCRTGRLADQTATALDGRPRGLRSLFGGRFRRRARTGCRRGDGGPPATLDDVLPGEACRVVALHCHGPVRRRLLDMGLVPEVRVDVIRNAPLRDPIEIRIHDTFLTLRRVEAARIEVLLVGPDVFSGAGGP